MIGIKRTMDRQEFKGEVQDIVWKTFLWWALRRVVLGNYKCACLCAFVGVCTHAWPCACCARVLFFHCFMLNEHSGCSRGSLSIHWKHRAPAGLCARVHRQTSLVRPILPIRSRPFPVVSFHISNTVPSTTCHTLNRVTAVGHSLIQKGHANLFLQAVQTWMSCRFHRNDGCYF